MHIVQYNLMSYAVTEATKSETAQFWVLLGATIAAFLAAACTAWAANCTSRASTGAALLNCLDKYIQIMKDRRDAEGTTLKKAEDFYRELFDLHWSEFHLWQKGVIPNNVMQSWLWVRKRNFDKDEIRHASGSLRYADYWNTLKAENYFEINDPFVRFMDAAHSGQVHNMKKIKKETKK